MAEQKAHAKLSASSASRWINCPGSIALIEKAPPPRESKYALEGTRAHECMEKILRKEYSDIHDIYNEYGEEMVENVFHMQQAVDERVSCFSEVIVEEKVKFPLSDHEGNEMFGTVDCAIVDIDTRLTVIDYKHGAGHPVEPENNLQMMYYAIALADKYDWRFNDVELVIVQPRSFHSENTTRSWVIGIDDLKKQTVYFEKGIERIKKKPRTFAGDWCKFCAASVICPEQTKKQLEVANIAFDEPLVDNTPKFPAARDLTPNQIGIIIEKANILEAWISEVREYAEGVLNRGGTVPGLKLVEKRGTRKWSNPLEVEKDAADAFGSKAYSRELLSPAQMEKVAGKDWVSPRTVSVSSGLTMVSADDKRPAVNPTTLKLTGFDEPLEGITSDKKEKGKKESSEKSKKESGKKGVKKSSAKKTKDDLAKSETEDCGF